jgi:hypothetical protein
MRIEPGSPVVGELRGEDVVWERVHLAAPEKRWLHGRRAFADYAWIPLEWPTLCGLNGYLYRYAGTISDSGVPFCSVCIKRCHTELGGVAVTWEQSQELEVVA